MGLERNNYSRETMTSLSLREFTDSLITQNFTGWLVLIHVYLQ